MVRVFPGDLLTIASPLLPVRALISEDLPTLLRPMTATSGRLSGSSRGQSSRRTALPR